MFRYQMIHEIIHGRLVFKPIGKEPEEPEEPLEIEGEKPQALEVAMDVEKPPFEEVLEAVSSNTKRANQREDLEMKNPCKKFIEEGSVSIKCYICTLTKFVIHFKTGWRDLWCRSENVQYVAVVLF